MLATCLVARDDYDAIDISYHRGNDPADVAGLFVDAFVAWISPPLAFIRRVRGRNGSFWIPDIVSLLMEGTYGMERGLTDRTVAGRTKGGRFGMPSATPTAKGPATTGP